MTIRYILLRSIPLFINALCSSAAIAETAIVNTPGDGFLALRSQPSTRLGVRLEKIPDATRLLLSECVSSSSRDRWCRTTFKGNDGWVLDQFLIRGVGEETKLAEARVQSPPKGDRSRTAILDAIRTEYSKPVTFRVHNLKVVDNWAWATVTATSNGEDYEPGSYLVREDAAKWRVVGQVDGAGEESVVDLQYRELRAKFADVPDQLFER